MKCPKCEYTSFAHLENCPKCGFGLTEPRAALGIYAIQPDPPDLRLAYQATSLEVGGPRLSTPVIPPAHDLSPLEGIDLESSELESGGDETGEPEAATKATDEANADRLGTQDTDMSHSPDLHRLGDIVLALEKEADLGDESPPHLTAAEEMPEAKQVYDLDVDDELGDLPLGPIVNESMADEDDEATAEYTLEIDEDLEFEVEELALGQDEEDEDEDDEC